MNSEERNATLNNDALSSAHEKAWMKTHNNSALGRSLPFASGKNTTQGQFGKGIEGTQMLA